MPRLAVCALLAAVPLAAAGCGNDRVESGSVFDAKPGKVTKALSYPDAGLKVTVPKEFDVKDSTAPQLFRASLDAAFISAFAYRRKEQIPKEEEELQQARRRLVAAAKRRDKTFKLKRSKVVKVNGVPGVELRGEQTIFKGRLRLRSLHLYKGNGEYVVELVAPVAAFGALERSSFPGILKSLKVTGKVKPPPKKPKKKAAAKKSKAGSDEGKSDSDKGKSGSDEATETTPPKED
jgi:hypothetical protein